MAEKSFWLPEWKAERLATSSAGIGLLPVILSMLSFSRRLASLGAFPGKSGNFSTRFGQGLLITPQAVSKRELTPEAFVLVYQVDWAGKVVRFMSRSEEVRPSSDILLHHVLYCSFSDCSAVVHMHVGFQGPSVQLPYPIVEQRAVNPLIDLMQKGHKAINLLNHNAILGEGKGASIIVGESMEETFRYALRLLWL